MLPFAAVQGAIAGDHARRRLALDDESAGQVGLDHLAPNGNATSRQDRPRRRPHEWCNYLRNSEYFQSM